MLGKCILSRDVTFREEPTTTASIPVTHEESDTSDASNRGGDGKARLVSVDENESRDDSSQPQENSDESENDADSSVWQDAPSQDASEDALSQSEPSEPADEEPRRSTRTRNLLLIGESFCQYCTLSTSRTSILQAATKPNNIDFWSPGIKKSMTVCFATRLGHLSKGRQICMYFQANTYSESRMVAQRQGSLLSMQSTFWYRLPRDIRASRQTHYNTYTPRTSSAIQPRDRADGRHYCIPQR